MNKPTTVLKALTAIALLLLVVSCNTTENSQGILIVQAIDQATDPFGDIVTSGGTIPTDTIDITLFNKPVNPYSVDSGNFGDIIVEQINVLFSRIDGGTDVPASFEVPYSVQVPHNGTVTIENFPVLPGTVKNTFPLSDLLAFGFERSTNYQSIRMKITLEISGKTTSGDPILARGFLTVEVTDWAG